MLRAGLAMLSSVRKLPVAARVVSVSGSQRCFAAALARVHAAPLGADARADPFGACACASVL
jgi:hypothetical protein